MMTYPRIIRPQRTSAEPDAWQDWPDCDNADTALAEWLESRRASRRRWAVLFYATLVGSVAWVVLVAYVAKWLLA